MNCNGLEAAIAHHLLKPRVVNLDSKARPSGTRQTAVLDRQGFLENAGGQELWPVQRGRFLEAERGIEVKSCCE